VDSTIEHLIKSEPAANGPAFSGPRWNIAVVILVAVVAIFSFLVVQVAIFSYLFLKTHPDMVRFLREYGFLPQNAMNQHALIQMLSAKNLWISSVTSELVLAIVTLVLAIATLGITPDKLGLGKFPGVGRVAAAVAVGVALVIVTNIVGGVQNVVFGPQPPQLQALVLLSHHGWGQFALDLMSVSVAAPIGEETFFRGFVFTGLVQRMPVWGAAAISALLFSGAHFEKFQVLPIFVVGLGLAYVYYQTRSLWCSMAAHATFNGVSLIAAYFFPSLVH
jgi:membrane protease YdiL (CAAX protease family)